MIAEELKEIDQNENWVLDMRKDRKYGLCRLSILSNILV